MVEKEIRRQEEIIRVKREQELDKNTKKKKKMKPRKKPKKKKTKKKKTTDEDAPPPPITSLSFKFTRVDMGTVLMLLLASVDERTQPTSIMFRECYLGDKIIKMMGELLQRESEFKKVKKIEFF